MPRGFRDRFPKNPKRLAAVPQPLPEGAAEVVIDPGVMGLVVQTAPMLGMTPGELIEQSLRRMFTQAAMHTDIGRLAAAMRMLQTPPAEAEAPAEPAVEEQGEDPEKFRERLKAEAAGDGGKTGEKDSQDSDPAFPGADGAPAADPGQITDRVEGPYNCGECGSAYQTEPELDAHLAEFHDPAGERQTEDLEGARIAREARWTDPDFRLERHVYSSPKDGQCCPMPVGDAIHLAPVDGEA